MLNSPANPTGATATRAEVRGLAELAREHDIALVSDEIYSQFCYDQPFVSPAEFNERTIVIDGFSKNYAMTGWRLGFVHGPAEIIDTMVKVQQYTFVCAPQPAQWAGAVAMDVDITERIDAYHRKRDLIVDGLSDRYEIARPGGAFYVFPRVPWGTATEFVQRGDRAQSADHSRQGFQSARHAFPHLVRGPRRGPAPRYRRPPQTGPSLIAWRTVPKPAIDPPRPFRPSETQLAADPRSHNARSRFAERAPLKPPINQSSPSLPSLTRSYSSAPAS